ncbi:MAG: hypothetical protein ACRD21_07180 [Vicinamibacteria bacterium]
MTSSDPLFYDAAFPARQNAGLETLVKKLWWLLASFVVATAVREGLDYFGPMAQAFRAYRTEAEAYVRGQRDDPRFESIEGSVIEVGYRLESAEREEDGGIRLVVVEAVQFQKFSESGPFGNRRVAQTRQHVVMRSVDERWVLSDLREETTEVTELGSVTSQAE